MGMLKEFKDFAIERQFDRHRCWFCDGSRF